MKKCPFCGEMINDVAKKCRFCGEWLEKTESEEYKTVETNENDNANQASLDNLQKCSNNLIPEEAKNSLIGLVTLVVIGLIFFAIFSDPLSELTSGCSKDGNLVDGENYYCKNKSWEKVRKTMSNTPPYYDYLVYAKKDKGYMSELYWSEGEYKCKIYNYVYNGNGWHWDDNYKGVCTEKEFIQKVKEAIEEYQDIEEEIKKRNSVTTKESNEDWDKWRFKLQDQMEEELKDLQILENEMLEISFFVDFLGRPSFLRVNPNSSKIYNDELYNRLKMTIRGFGDKYLLQFPASSNLTTIRVDGYIKKINETDCKVNLSVYKTKL